VSRSPGNFVRAWPPLMNKGVLHRDLKPANVMIDGKGRVRITDFGLAKLAEDGQENEVAGTPAYMAPEQLVRGESSARTDIYSLGLILYELFTGEAAHRPGSIAELKQLHQDSSSTRPSTLVDGLDPAIETVILRCLEKDPGERPVSVAAIAAALPGGDPLAAALAAGETPSPELVAAAGEAGALSLRTGIACLALLLVGLGVYPFLCSFLHAKRMGLTPQAESPSDLDTRVRTVILGPLEYWNRDEKPRHSLHGLQVLKGTDTASRMEFWYRQSNKAYLTPEPRLISNGPRVYGLSPSNPPPFEAGMASVRVDLQGKLLELLVPNGKVSQSVGQRHGDEDINRLFDQAGLLWSDFQLIKEPAERPAYSTPPAHADEVSLYRPEDSSSTTRVVLVWDRHRIVYFYAGPFVKGGLPKRQFVASSEPAKSKDNAPKKFLDLTVFVLALILGLRNLRLGRADPGVPSVMRFGWQHFTC